MKKNFYAIFLTGLIIAGWLSSCQILQISQTFTEKTTVTPTAFVSQTDLIPETSTENQSIHPENRSETPCAYMWANQFLPEESRKIEKLLIQAEFENLRVVAEAFGENCVTAAGENIRFAAMQTDLRLFVKVQSLSNQTELGNLAGRLLKIVFEISSNDLPGTQPGYIGIQFTSDQDEVLNLWFKRDWAEEVLESGIRGEELLRELQKK